MDWEAVDRDFLEFTRTVSALRAAHPVFRRRRFFDGRPVGRRGIGTIADITWFTPDGEEMIDEDWESGFGRSMSVHLNGMGIPDRGRRGEPTVDDSFLLCFNAHVEPLEFTLPQASYGSSWTVVVSTGGEATDHELAPGAVLTVPDRSLVVLPASE